MTDNATHAAHVKVNLRSGLFEISGSEEFIEKMIENISPLFPSPEQLVADDEEEGSGSGGGGTPGKELKNLDDLGDFISVKGMTANMPAENSVTAFVYYLTKVKGAESCSREEIEACYDEAGFALPNNLTQTLGNLMKPERRGFLASGGRGGTS